MRITSLISAPHLYSLANTALTHLFVLSSNLISEHIMMDAKAIIPTGWHFVSHFCEPDGITKISPLERRSYPVRYYFVGFGNVYHVPHQKQPLVTDIGGGDGDVPELLQGKPYDPFKLDVYTLGNIFKKELHEVRLLAENSVYLYSVLFSFQKYHGLDFIVDLLQHMHVQEFTLRPNAENTLREWYSIRRRLNEDLLENTYLTYKDGVRMTVSPTLPIEQTSPAGSLMSTKSTSGSARSDKRDISSILNKVCLWSSG